MDLEAMEISGYKERFGAVALLDGLGTKSTSTEDAIRYLQAFADIEEKLESVQKVNDVVKCMNSHFFGDTIILTLEIAKEEDEIRRLSGLGFLVSYITRYAIGKDVLFRGAISIGDYVEGRSSVLGPAVTDAANWFEELEMIGTMATPKASMRLKYLAERMDSKRKFFFNDEWRLCSVETKTGEITIYLANWAFLTAFEEPFPKRWFYKHLGGRDRGVRDEKKYRNTETYFLAELGRASERVAGADESDSPRT